MEKDQKEYQPTKWIESRFTDLMKGIYIEDISLSLDERYIQEKYLSMEDLILRINELIEAHLGDDEW